MLHPLLSLILVLVIVVLMWCLSNKNSETFEGGVGGGLAEKPMGSGQAWLANEWDSYKFGQTQDEYLNYWQGKNNNDLYLPDCVTCSDEICRGIRKPGSFCINTSGPMKGITQRCPSR